MKIEAKITLDPTTGLTITSESAEQLTSIENALKKIANGETGLLHRGDIRLEVIEPGPYKVGELVRIGDGEFDLMRIDHFSIQTATGFACDGGVVNRARWMIRKASPQDEKAWIERGIKRVQSGTGSPNRMYAAE